MRVRSFAVCFCTFADRLNQENVLIEPYKRLDRRKHPAAGCVLRALRPALRFEQCVKQKSACFLRPLRPSSRAPPQRLPRIVNGHTCRLNLHGLRKQRRTKRQPRRKQGVHRVRPAPEPGATMLRRDSREGGRTCSAFLACSPLHSSDRLQSVVNFRLHFGHK